MRKMRLLVVLASVFSILSSPSVAQTSVPTVYWSEGSCSSSNFSRPPATRCFSFYNEGMLFWSFTHDGLTVTSSVYDEDDYYTVGVGIKNGTNQRFTFEPTHVRLSVKTSNKENARVYPLGYISGDEIARSYSNRAAWANALGGAGAGMSNNPADKVIEAGRASERSITAAVTGASYVNRELRTTTFFPGSEAMGLIYFKRKRSVKSGEVSIIVNGVRYVYSFRMGK